MRVLLVQISDSMVVGAIDLADTMQIDPDGLAARGPATYTTFHEGGGESVVEYEAVYAADEGTRFVSDDEAGPGWKLLPNGTFESPVAEELPAGPQFTYKSDMIRRMTEDEADVLAEALDKASSRLRLLYNSISQIDHDAPEFSVLVELMTQALVASGVKQKQADSRVKELLAPS